MDGARNWRTNYGKLLSKNLSKTLTDIRGGFVYILVSFIYNLPFFVGLSNFLCLNDFQELIFFNFINKLCNAIFYWIDYVIKSVREVHHPFNAFAHVANICKVPVIQSVII